jgi:hypothetical protein
VTRKRKRIRLGLMIGLMIVAAVASIGPISAAVASFSGGLTLDVQINTPATLASRGAAVNVPLNVLCNSTTADVNVQVTERVGSKIAQGFGHQEITCTGLIQPVTVTVPATSYAFKQGTGIVNAEIFGCGHGTCGNVSATSQVSIVKK